MKKTLLTIFHSNEFIRILLPQLVVFVSVAHQRKYNFLYYCLLESEGLRSAVIRLYFLLNPLTPDSAKSKTSQNYKLGKML